MTMHNKFGLQREFLLLVGSALIDSIGHLTIEVTRRTRGVLQLIELI